MANIVQRIGDVLHDMDNISRGLPTEAEFQRLDEEYTAMMHADEDNLEALSECEAAMATIGMVPCLNTDGTFSFVDE